MKKVKWEPENFELEMNTVWDFPERGSWATHDAKYRGNWSPYIPRNLLLRYSKEGDWVLDQFAGGGTTLVEAKLLHRNCIGLDVNPAALSRCHEKCDFPFENAGKIIIREGDARHLDFLPDASIDFICTHPPYADIIRYSEDLASDLSHLRGEAFLAEMEKVAGECYRVLKKGKFCAILMGGYEAEGLYDPSQLPGHGTFSLRRFYTERAHREDPA